MAELAHKASYAFGNSEVECAHSYSIEQDFTHSPNLGLGLPIAVVVKQAVNREELRKRASANLRQYRENKNAYFPRRTSVERGYVQIGVLKHGFDKDVVAQKIEGEEPRCVVFTDSCKLIGFSDHLVLYDRENGTEIKRISNNLLKSVHSIELSKTRPNIALIACMGTDRVVEMNLDTEEIVWEWNPWEHGINKNKIGIRLADCEQHIKDGEKQIGFEEAQRLALKGDSSCRGYVHYVDIDALQSPLGLESWQKVLKPCSAAYGKDEETVIISSFERGELLQVDKISGDILSSSRGYFRPHDFIVLENGYLLSDSMAGRIVIFDQNLKADTSIQFSRSFDAECSYALPCEWIQNSTVISRDGLIATIDSKRNLLYVWNLKTFEYETYSYGAEIAIQKVVPSG